MKKGDQGKHITGLQKLLVKRGYPVGIDGVYGALAYRAVSAFRAQNMDPHSKLAVLRKKPDSAAAELARVCKQMRDILGAGAKP
ncbi:MAG: hypothetical protein OEV15_06595 [Gallionella sp.]|nr:hypothetical protein [Gallionella sp.]